VPSRCVGVRLRQRRITRHESARGLIGIVLFAALLSESRTSDAALASAVDACKNVDTWLRCGTHLNP
jgi:hypothetical protein